jgi:hypothetical protein
MSTLDFDNTPPERHDGSYVLVLTPGLVDLASAGRLRDFSNGIVRRFGGEVKTPESRVSLPPTVRDFLSRATSDELRALLATTQAELATRD